MSRMLSAILVASLTLVATVAPADDDLFSEVSIESVFGSTAVRKPAESGLATGKRIAGASGLSRTLQEAGLDAEEVDSRTVRTRVKGEATGEHAVLISVDVDAEQLKLVLPLASIDESKADSRRLLELLAASREANAVFFAYDAAEKRLELRRFLANNGVTATGLQEHLTQLATVADNTRTSWDPQGAAQKENSPTTGRTSTGSSADTSKFRLIGTWTGSSGSQAFALQLQSDKKFVLAVVQGKRQTRSEGTFTLDNQAKLTLAGTDGTKLSGTVRPSSNDSFQLTLDGGTALTFKRSK